MSLETEIDLRAQGWAFAALLRVIVRRLAQDETDAAFRETMNAMEKEAVRALEGFKLQGGNEEGNTAVRESASAYITRLLASVRRDVS